MVEEGGKRVYIIVDKEFLFCAVIRISIPWEIAFDTGIPRETDMKKTVILCCCVK